MNKTKPDHSWMSFKEAQSLLLLNDINRVAEAMENWTPEILGQMLRAVDKAAKQKENQMGNDNKSYLDAVMELYADR